MNKHKKKWLTMGKEQDYDPFVPGCEQRVHGLMLRTERGEK